jgi:tetratricopeptide (TPR) repeat protein
LRLVSVLEARGDLASARGRLTELLERHPDHAAAWRRLAELSGRAEDWDGALVAFQRLVALEQGEGWSTPRSGCMTPPIEPIAWRTRSRGWSGRSRRRPACDRARASAGGLRGGWATTVGWPECWSRSPPRPRTLGRLRRCCCAQGAAAGAGRGPAGGLAGPRGRPGARHRQL